MELHGVSLVIVLPATLTQVNTSHLNPSIYPTLMPGFINSS